MPARHRCIPLCFVLLASILVIAPNGRAQSVPALSSGPAIVLQPGQTQQITLKGSRLARVDQIVIANARGLQATLNRPHPTTEPATQPAEKEKLSESELQIQLSVDSDAALGERELRLAVPAGVSGPFRVLVSQYPHIEEQEPNNTPDKAQEIALPAVLTGKINAPGDIDCFRFNAKHDQSVVFDVHAARSGSALEPVIAIHDAQGHEQPAHADYHGDDFTLVFQPPADGQYEIEIRDLEFRGGDNYAYRIDAGPIPYVRSLIPMSAQPGKISEVRPVGVNLEGLDHIPLDLSYAALGTVGVRGRTREGLTNEIPFEISDLPVYVEHGQNHSAAEPETVPYPVQISGRIDATGDEDFFKFHIDRKQLVMLQAAGRRLGSAIDALLTLRNVKGESIVTNDDAGGPDARIIRDLDAGDYIASVRDLTFHGGESYAYRLSIAPGASASGQNFSVKFAPDAIRVSQGGTAVVLCDIARTGGFKGDVTLTFEGLPPGLTIPPVVLPQNSSDLFTITASNAAVLGTYPIQLRATAMIDNHPVSKLAQPMLGKEPVQQAYLSVLEPAPFTIEGLTGLAAPRLQQLSAEASALAAKLTQPDPKIDAAQAQWEKKIASPLIWESMDNAAATSAQGTQFTSLPDGSFLATGKVPEKDTYTVTIPAHVQGITAIRLEVLPDDSLPEKGPGRHGGDGNFVLSHFTLEAAPASDPGKATNIPLLSPRAILEQEGYGVINAIQPMPNKGWAIYPYHGKANAAYFFLAKPIGEADGTVLTFKLDQQFDKQFTIGRFRLSLTTDPDAQAKVGVPASITDLADIAPEQRTAQQKSALTAYYRGIDPLIAAESKRAGTIYTAIGPYVEIARLEAALAAKSPQIDAGRAAWEKQVLAGGAWLPMEITDAKSANGATLTRQPDGSILVSGNAPATDVYTLVAPVGIKSISAIRIEALPDVSLPGNGPGRADNGNFVLTKLSVAAAAKGAAPAPIEFRGATASFEQQGYRALGALDDRDDTGWAVMPNLGAPSVATFYPSTPISADAGTQLTIQLEQKFAAVPRHTLGRFRIWVTGDANPDSAIVLPADVLAALRAPADKRDRVQRTTIENYYRATAQSLEPLRFRLEELKAQTAEAMQHPRYMAGEIPILVNRNNFDGQITVTMEGFSVARKRPLDQNLKVTSLRIEPGALAGVLKYQVEPAAEAGTRLAALRAEAKIGDETYVQYAPAFPLTVTEAK